MSTLRLMVLSYPKPLGLSSARRTIATLPDVSGADSLFNPISSPSGLTGSDINLPNVVQSESRIVNLFTPITASGRVIFHVHNVNERFHHGDGTAGLHADLLRFCPYPIATLGSGRAMIFFLDSTRLWYSSNSVLSLNITVLDFALPVFSQEKPSLCL